MKPNLNKIIQDNLDKSKFQSKVQPSLPKNTGWLDEYVGGGTYMSDKALATQFGQYPNGGQPIIVNNPNDPRLKAYNDSLDLYNSTAYFEKEILKDALRRGTKKEIISNNQHRKAVLVNPDYLLKQPNKPISINKYTKQEPYEVAYTSNYKKPVQPVIYQKPTFNDFVKTVNPDYMSDDYDLEAAYKNLPEKTMKAWAKDPEKNHLPDTYKKPNHPTFSKESIYYKPGMEAGTWHEDVYIPNRGQIVGRNNNLQEFSEKGLINRPLQKINVGNQPTNYSFHYPIEGTFDKANPQGVKYFKDKAEWQKFLDENDYNSAEERNGMGQASGTLKKGKYGGWLSKYIKNK